MQTRKMIAVFVAVAGSAAPAFAQDSTAKSAGLPGDAVSAFQTSPSTQKLNYVLDLAPLYGSWNTRFGVAPLIKTSKSSSGFFNSLQSASGISVQAQLGATPAASTYAEWFSSGEGVNPDSLINDVPSTISAPLTYTALGAVQAEFATDSGGRNFNGILSAAFGYDPASPGRLYVSRYVAAVNQPSNGAGDTAQFGVGAVDAYGNVAIRADNSQIVDTVNGITGNNYFRIDMLSRNPSVINQISNGATMNATDWIDISTGGTNSSTTTHNTPNLLPENLGGGLARVIGSNFSTQYIWENGALNGTNTSTSHRPGTVDHRGSVGMYPHALLGGTGEVATGAMLSQVVSGETRSASIWGIKADGSVGTAVTVTPPLSLTDACYSFTFNPTLSESVNHLSQTPFRGGNGMVAVGRNVNAQKMVAFTLASSEVATNPFEVIALGTDDATTPYQNMTWSLPAWIDTPNLSGKPIHGDYGNDGIAFTSDTGEFDGNVDLNPLSPTYDAPIGRLASLFEVTGGTPVGPSMSAPMIDSAGNIWFMSAVALNKSEDGTPFTDFDSALVRAIFDPINNCYRLELILELGDTFDGTNSGTKYQVQFIGGIADSNSIDSASQWSNNIVADGWNGQETCATRDTRNPRNLGGLTFNARIVYDINNDGTFSDPTSGGGDPMSPDQGYVVSMYLGNVLCPADFDGSGFVDADDFNAFNDAFTNGENSADFDCSGFVDGDDFSAFSAAFDLGC
jgi:hypothetical protein